MTGKVINHGMSTQSKMIEGVVRTADAMGYVLAIHLYEAQKWLREAKNIIVDVCYYSKTDKYNEHWYWILYQNGHKKNISGILSATYEEALSEGIKEAVKILKEK